MDRQKVEDLVFKAIDRVNELLPEGSALEKNANELLAGPGSKLDSMGMVNFTFALEEEISRAFRVELRLSDAAVTGANDPLETVGSLVTYLEGTLGK